MSSGIVRQVISAPAKSTFAPHLCVALDAAGLVGPSQAADCYGVCATRANKIGQLMDVIPINSGGTTFFTAGGVIAIHDVCDIEDGGKIVAGAGATPVCINLEAAAADGDIIECLMIPAAMGVSVPT